MDAFSVKVETNHTGIQVIANADELILFLRNTHQLSNSKIASLCNCPTTSVSRWLKLGRANYEKLSSIIEKYSVAVTEVSSTASFEKFVFIIDEFDNLNKFVREVNNKIEAGYIPLGGAQAYGGKIYISMIKK